MHIPLRVSNEQIYFAALMAIAVMFMLALVPPFTGIRLLLFVPLAFLTFFLLLFAVFWEWFRWHPPFTERAITEQIKKGLALKKHIQAGELEKWSSEILETIDRYWQKSSFQYQTFSWLVYPKSEGGSVYGSSYPDPLLKLEWRLECLKGLSTCWFGPQR